jgi:hypothetical protein
LPRDFPRYGQAHPKSQFLSQAILALGIAYTNKGHLGPLCQPDALLLLLLL